VAEEGSYLIDQVFVKTKLRKPISPVYFFDINRTMFERIDNNTINSTINLRFIDDDERKTAVIELNDHIIFTATLFDPIFHERRHDHYKKVLESTRKVRRRKKRK